MVFGTPWDRLGGAHIHTHTGIILPALLLPGVPCITKVERVGTWCMHLAYTGSVLSAHKLPHSKTVFTAAN